MLFNDARMMHVDTLTDRLLVDVDNCNERI